jgi:hypothetical protein
MVVGDAKEVATEVKERMGAVLVDMVGLVWLSPRR